MCDIMVSLLDEMDAVDVSTIDILMENLLPSNKVHIFRISLLHVNFPVDVTVIGDGCC